MNEIAELYKNLPETHRACAVAVLKALEFAAAVNAKEPKNDKQPAGVN